MTVVSFLARYPEFSEDRAPTDLVQDALDRAARAVSGEDWGSQLDDARGEYAAHLLAVSPWGQQARLSDPKSEATTYLRQFKKRQRSVHPAAFVSRY